MLPGVLEAGRPRAALGVRMPSTVLPPLRAVALRPRAAGKFLFVGDDKLYVRGATRVHGRLHHESAPRDPDAVERALERLAASGIEAIDVPHCESPRALLDAAGRHGLRVMLGLSAERQVGGLIDGTLAEADLEAAIRSKVRDVAGHPALLCHSLCEEIQPSLVRWLGRHRVERCLERLRRAVKAEDPLGLVTHAIGSSAESPRLPSLDLFTFKVSLQDRHALAAGLSRVNRVIGDRPVLVCEASAQDRCRGDVVESLRAAFEAGCAGAFVVPGVDASVAAPEAAAQAWAVGTPVERALATTPFGDDVRWPRISVVVCSLNGERTIGECLDGLQRLEYPDFEVIVVDDGSTDGTAALARSFGFTVISTENRGLSSARNTGLAAATGEFVAYLDDDAFPDPHWLKYLALTFLRTSHAGVGGPNLAPLDEGPTAASVARAPGGPVHVLLPNGEAEHVPGCNMAFRVSALRAVGGFDPLFRTAGDDVDLCWRFRQRGFTLGFNAGAMVWHRRRASTRAYWKQQQGYGRAEALLARKWPERYNSAGHVAWSGNVYGDSFTDASGGAPGIYQGAWRAPQASVPRAVASLLSTLPLMPDWYVVVAALAVLSALGASWPPLLAVVPLLVAAVAAPVVRAALAGSGMGNPAHVTTAGPPHRGLVALLHLLQPLARLTGRLQGGLWPGRRHGQAPPSGLAPLSFTALSSYPQRADERLRLLEATLRLLHARVVRGGRGGRHDLEIRGGMLGGARLKLAVEDRGEDRQVVRARAWPWLRPRAVAFVGAFGALAAWAAADRAWLACSVLAAVAMGGACSALLDCAHAMASTRRALKAANAPAS